jgi:hypothetical protein
MLMLLLHSEKTRKQIVSVYDTVTEYGPSVLGKVWIRIVCCLPLVGQELHRNLRATSAIIASWTYSSRPIFQVVEQFLCRYPYLGPYQTWLQFRYPNDLYTILRSISSHQHFASRVYIPPETNAIQSAISLTNSSCGSVFRNDGSSGVK